MTVRIVPTSHYAKTDAHDMYAAREPFKTHGSMRGEYAFTTNPNGGEPIGYRPYSGRLNAEESARLDDAVRIARETNASLYVVYSYDTPIAWVIRERDSESAYRVSQRFSVTTSKHQGRIY